MQQQTIMVDDNASCTSTSTTSTASLSSSDESNSITEKKKCKSFPSEKTQSSWKKKQNNQSPKKKRSKRKKPTSKKEYLSEEEKSRYVALDCEMVGLSDHRSSLARVCIIDWDGSTLLDLYVKQREPVTDYRTFVSGITSEHLIQNSAVDLEECQCRVKSLLQNKILVGHALKNDLNVLQLSHPWHQLRDTGKYEPFMKTRFDDNVLWPRKLKDLAKEKLNQEIQVLGRPHCPFEDATAALALYKKVCCKWEKIMAYKVKKTKAIQNAAKK